MSTKKRIEPLAGGAKKKPKSKVVSTLLWMDTRTITVPRRLSYTLDVQLALKSSLGCKPNTFPCYTVGATVRHFNHLHGGAVCGHA